MKKGNILFYATGIIIIGTAIGYKIVRNQKHKKTIEKEENNCLKNNHNNNEYEPFVSERKYIKLYEDIKMM